MGSTALTLLAALLGMTLSEVPGPHQDPMGAEGETKKRKMPKKKAMPSHVDVCLTSAVIGPTKPDGAPWDVGQAALAKDKQKAFDQGIQTVIALIPDKPTQVAAAIADLFREDAIQALVRPDVFGKVEFAPAGIYGDKGAKKKGIASESSPIREFTPAFGSEVCFKDLKFDPEMRFRVELTDKDLTSNDRIGTVELVAGDVRTAFEHGKSRHVPTADQDTTSIKLLAITVTKGQSAK